MLFMFTVTVEVERETGRFVSRDDIGSELVTALEDANPGDLWVNDSEYTVADWQVDEEVVKKKKA